MFFYCHIHCFHFVLAEDHRRPSPAKVIRHINGHSGWIVSTPVSDTCVNERPTEPVRTFGEPSRDHSIGETIENIPGERNMVEKHTSGHVVQHVETDVSGSDPFGRKPVSITHVLDA